MSSNEIRKLMETLGTINESSVYYTTGSLLWELENAITKAGISAEAIHQNGTQTDMERTVKLVINGTAYGTQEFLIKIQMLNNSEEVDVHSPNLGSDIDNGTVTQQRKFY